MALSVRIKKKLGSFLLDVDFVSENHRLALLGASGCGKSVTLRCIAGIMTPDEGHIELDGKILFDSRKGINLSPQKRQIGYLFQQYALFPNMTVEQNIRVAVRDKAKQNDVSARLVHMFQLENVVKNHPFQLSGGQQQRLALARILASEPKILMLDEPFSALDSFLKAQLEQELADMLDSFVGDVIWVTHDRDEVFHNCTRICVIENGNSQTVVTPDELFYNPTTVSAAKLSGCKNIVKIIPSDNSDKSVYVPDWKLTLKCDQPVSNDVSAIGLRAHHINLADEQADNAVRCVIVRALDNVFSTILILKPVDAKPDSPSLRMEMDKTLWKKLKDTEIVTVSITPKNILLLR